MRRNGPRLLSLLCALLVLAGHVCGFRSECEGVPQRALRAGADRVAVVMIVDASTYKGALLAMHSMLLSSSDPRRVGFHIIVLPSADGAFNSAVLSGHGKTKCLLRQYANSVHFKDWSKPAGYPATVANRGFDADHIYARFYIPELFPELKRYIYIDNDVIVTGDIIELFHTPLIPYKVSRRGLPKRPPAAGAPAGSGDGCAVGFVVEKAYFYEGYLKAHFNASSAAVRRHLSSMGKFTFFNAGVILVNAELWRALGLTGRAEAIIAANSAPGQWTFNSAATGDQGVFYLLLGSDMGVLHPRWNMRRSPVNHIRPPYSLTTGVYHLAGVTRGDTATLCSPQSTLYNLFTAALPVFLSAVTSFHKEHPACPYAHDAQACRHTAVAVRAFHSRNGSTVQYNPGLSTALSFREV